MKVTVQYRLHVKFAYCPKDPRINYPRLTSLCNSFIIPAVFRYLYSVPSSTSEILQIPPGWINRFLFLFSSPNITIITFYQHITIVLPQNYVHHQSWSFWSIALKIAIALTWRSTSPQKVHQPPPGAPYRSCPTDKNVHNMFFVFPF